MEKGDSRLDIVSKENHLSMSKRSQITVFIIIAVLIVVAVFIIYYSLQSSREQKLDATFQNDVATKADVNSLQNSVGECMKDSTYNALRTIGIQGGFYAKPAHAYDLGWAFIPYYYYSGNYLMPDKQRVQDELSGFVEDKMVECVDKLSYKNFDLIAGDPKTLTTLTKGKAKFVIDMPLTLKKGDKTSVIQLKNMPVVYNSSLYDILEVATYITTTHLQDNRFFCINCIVDMATERNLYVDFLDFGEGSSTTLVTITENYTSSEPYLFEFLNKY
jgi:hypothetical protein